MPKRIGIVPYRYAAPIAGRLRTSARSAFEITGGSSGELAIRLRQRSLDGAFLSPIDYGREYQMYHILPHTGISSAGKSGSVLLFFREGSRAITTIAADPHFSSEIVLAHLVLLEKYDTRPSIVPMTGSVEDLLRKADAALVAGDIPALAGERENKIDLVDEWTDITDLPFVHGIWVTREGSLTAHEAGLLSDSGTGADLPGDEDLLPFQYELTDDAVSGMNEFFRLAYYHGVLADIPDIRFLKTDTLTSDSAF